MKTIDQEILKQFIDEPIIHTSKIRQDGNVFAFYFFTKQKDGTIKVKRVVHIKLHVRWRTLSIPFGVLYPFYLQYLRIRKKNPKRVVMT